MSDDYVGHVKDYGHIVLIRYDRFVGEKCFQLATSHHDLSDRFQDALDSKHKCGIVHILYTEDIFNKFNKMVNLISKKCICEMEKNRNNDYDIFFTCEKFKDLVTAKKIVEDIALSDSNIETPKIETRDNIGFFRKIFNIFFLKN